MTQSIKFSLLVPSYNRPDMIRETVDSLVANAAPDVEIIVSDDASPRRMEIQERLEDLIVAGAVSYIQQPLNLKWSNNRNALVQAAKGDYVVLLGDDDRLKVGAVDRLRIWTNKNPEIALFGIGYDLIDELGRRTYTYCTPKPVAYRIAVRGHWRELFSFDAVPMWSHHPFTMCTKRHVSLETPYSTKVDIGDDLLFLFEVLHKGYQVLCIPEVLFEWRNVFDRTKSYSNLSGVEKRCWDARALILAELLKEGNLRAEVGTLLSEARFLMNFLDLSKFDAQDLGRIIAGRQSDVSEVTQFIQCHARRGPAPLHRKLGRHLRACRVLGPKHLLNVIHYFRDRRALKSTVR